VIEAIAGGFGDMDFEAAPADRPCEARPGSPEKVEAMADRILAGQDVRHERDNPGDG
jgi:hypothetical protein